MPPKCSSSANYIGQDILVSLERHHIDPERIRFDDITPEAHGGNGDVKRAFLSPPNEAGADCPVKVVAVKELRFSFRFHLEMAKRVSFLG